VLFGAFFIFFAYGGFARIAVVAEEIKDAKRNAPRAMLLALAISIVVYVWVGLVAVGLLGPAGLADSPSPLSSAMSITNNLLAVQIIAIGGLVATASVLLTSILGVSRMAFSMARRKDLPSALAQLHSRFFTPYYAIVGSGVLMPILVLFVDLTRVVAIRTFALLFNYSLTNLAAFKLKNSLSWRRLIPLLGLATCLLLLAFIFFASTDAWLTGVLFLFAGTIYYAVQRKMKRKGENLAT
jgi:APA family basic amino acid/polyamine antiporter